MELYGAGRKFSELAREFEPSEQTIRTWVKQADLDAVPCTGTCSTARSLGTSYTTIRTPTLTRRPPDLDRVGSADRPAGGEQEIRRHEATHATRRSYPACSTRSF